MIRRVLRFATFLAPGMFPVYEYITRRVSERLGVVGEMIVGETYDQLAEADVSFVCGLAYIELCGSGRLPFSAIAAPVLQGQRYSGRAIYFSDVIVRRQSRFRCFADLRGATWCYNEPLSHSGYGITRHHLFRLGQTAGFFREVFAAGYHQRSIELVRSGQIDASAIDSHVLSLAARDDGRLLSELRIIDSLGPSTIQPVVAADWLPETFREAIRDELLCLGDDDESRVWLDHAMIDRFTAVADGDYDDLRQMRDVCLQAGYAVVRGTWITDLTTVQVRNSGQAGCASIS